MNVSDRKYFSRFAMEPTLEYGQDDLYAFEFCYDNQPDFFDGENLLDEEDNILEDDDLL